MFILRFTHTEHYKKLNIYKKYEEIFKSSRKQQIFQLFTVKCYVMYVIFGSIFSTSYI